MKDSDPGPDKANPGAAHLNIAREIGKATEDMGANSDTQAKDLESSKAQASIRGSSQIHERVVEGGMGGQGEEDGFKKASSS